MNKTTRKALELLEKHGSGFLTVDATFTHGRGAKTRPYINITSAKALERRGLAKITYNGESSSIEAIPQS